ncbi:MAG: radical SAM protein, partial [Chthoniobacteraceae bacterium]
MTLLCTTETLLKRTTSRCPVCHAAVPGEVWKVNDGNGGDSAAPTARIFLRRECPEHGRAEACIASDARFYWLAQGDPQNQCCGGTCHAAEGQATGTLGRNAAGSAQSPVPVAPNAEDGRPRLSGQTGLRPVRTAGDGCLPGQPGRLSSESSASPGNGLFASAASQPSTLTSQLAQERLSTCLALIEIVNSCNLACPTCYADSPQSRAVDAVPLADLQARIQGVIDRKGGIEILQLSGGEPTLHPQFFELLAWLHAHPGIDYVLLNTNGVRIANDDAFSAELGRTFQRGKFQLYLQFDGTQEAAQHWLRGADLRATRERAIARCRDLGIPLTLAMTVTPENLPHVWDAVDFGLRWENVRGISFQPLFGSGRVSEKSAKS